MSETNRAIAAGLIFLLTFMWSAAILVPGDEAPTGDGVNLFREHCEETGGTFGRDGNVAWCEQ